MRKVHLELLYLLPVTKSRTHTRLTVYQFERLPGMGHLCRHSSPLVPPFDAFFALGGVLALGGVAVLLGVVFKWVVLAACPKGLYKGLRVEGCGRSDLTGLMSAHRFQYKLLLQQDIFLRYEDLWQHQSLFQQVRRRLAFWFHNMSSRNVKERFWAELQPLLAILRTKLSCKRNTEGSCFLCLALDHRQSPLTHDSFFTILTCSAAFPTAAPLIEGPEFWKMTKEENKLTCRNKSRLSTVSSRLVSTFYITRDYGQEA